MNCGKYINLIESYVDKILTYQRDPYRGTPLLGDAIDIHTGELLRWMNEDGSSPVVSNLAMQQNFMRLLVGLSELTGVARYKEVAMEITKYHFDHYRADNHLLYWGGHIFIDLETGKVMGPANKTMPHELKCCLPYYDLLFEVDSQKAAEFVEAFWNAHIYDWEEMEVGRHGNYRMPPQDYPFSHAFTYKEAHRQAKGLSFLNAGSDLIYAATKYFEHEKDQNAYKWAEFLMKQYIDARDPETKLGAYQFTTPMKQIDPVSEQIPDTNTLSFYGDRAIRQFGHRYKTALESKMLIGGRTYTMYAVNLGMLVQLYNEVGSSAHIFKEWAREAAAAFMTYLYDASSCAVRSMITDGTDMTHYIFEKDGYYGKKGTVLEPVPIDSGYLLAFARLYIALKKDEDRDDALIENVWQTIKSMAKGLGLGDLESETISKEEIKNHDAISLFAILDLYEATGEKHYLALAECIGEKILETYYHKGYFVEKASSKYSHVDAAEPLALLALEAAKVGKLQAIPKFMNGEGYIEGAYKWPDGVVRNTRSYEIYQWTVDDRL